MKLQDNVLKAYLKNVLFISGTPCGGKTTISRKLAEKYGLPVYDIDQEFGRHRFLSSPDVQPCMNKSFADADAFFGRSVEDTLRRVEQHFGLAARPITIHKVNKDTELSRSLIEFVENFSWEEVKEHILQSLRSWAFSDWETPFVALSGNRIVGMISLLKTDYYPLPEIYPWVTTLFVTEVYRGRRISQRLIDHANAYAKELGFERTYIPSEHVGLYEKYGYHYLKDIVNYGGGTDRLYVKEL